MDKRPSLLKYTSTRNTEIEPVIQRGRGKVATNLSRAIAYERTPSIFDTKEMADRDKALMAELETIDRKLSIERRNKPVYLSTYEARTLLALSYAISQEAEINPELKKKITNPFKADNPVRRPVNVTAVSQLLFGSIRKRCKENVIKALFGLGEVRQVQIIGTGDNQVKITAPFIMIGKTAEDLSPEKRNNLDEVEVYFGGAFFSELNNRYAIITPRLFEVWEKKGRGTQLFQTLLNHLLSIYWGYREAAIQTDKRLRKEEENKSLPPQELEEKIRTARREAMTYELNVSKFKNQIATDYDSKRSYRAKFITDFKSAIEGLKELDLIEEGRIEKGARGQDKIVLVFSETYNLTAKPTTPKLLTDTSANDEPSPF